MIVLATIVINCLLIAAPGFFSHDEWQRFDSVAKYGLHEYAMHVTHSGAGHDFGTPYRPIGFLEQGFSAQWMERYPFVPHMLDVLLHSAVALLLFHALCMARIGREVSTAAALLFGASPLTIMATGWVGASFDLWYTFFVVVACGATVRTCKTNISSLQLIVLAGATGGAVLSKETGIVTPLAIAISATGYFAANGGKIDWRKVGSCAGVSAVVVAIYLWFRMPALNETFAGTPALAYAPGIENLQRNLVSYLAYPFLWGISEIANFSLVPPVVVAVALLAHALLLLSIFLSFGVLAALLYVAAYMTFILPVLPLPGGGSHYLYACAVPMGLAIGSLLHREWLRRDRWGLGLLILLVVVLEFHAWRNEIFIYDTALCQTRFLDSLDTRLAIESREGNNTLIVRPVKDAPAHVGLRAIHDRERYSGALGFVVLIDQGHDMQEGDKRTMAVMNRQCTIR